MLKYTIITTLSILCFRGVISGQVTFLKDEIKWNDTIKNTRPGKNDFKYFKNAVFIDKNSNTDNYLPYYLKRVKLSGDKTYKYNFKFTKADFELFPDDELPSGLNKDNICDSVILRYSLLKDKKVPYLQYFFVPIRKNSQTGKIERLKSFEISLEATPYDKINISENASGFPQQSVFASGSWYKFEVAKTGIYKITYQDIKNLGISDPENVRIYGNGGSMLPEIFNGSVPNDPREIPLMMVSANSGTFAPGDYILFYAQGPVVWNYDSNSQTYNYSKNLYTDSIVYFITSQEGGKRIQPAVAPSASPNIQVNAYDGYAFHEADEVNILRSGKQWYEPFGVINSLDYSFDFPNLITGQPINIASQVVLRSANLDEFTFSCNNNALGTITLGNMDLTDDEGYYAYFYNFNGSFLSAVDNIDFNIAFNNNGNYAAQGWLTYIKITARQSLSKSQGPLMFRDMSSVNTGNIASFTISAAPSDLLVWNVDNINNPLQIQGSYSNNQYTFTASADSLHEYIAIDPQADFYTPTYLSGNKAVVQNQNLHAMTSNQYIVVTNPEFLSQAQELATFHSQHDNLSTLVVTTDQVYNEFSSGTEDPAAIRNFVKMLYDREQDSAKLPRYLLLFGDGSFDYKTKVYTNGTVNKNFVVAYESAESLYQDNTFVTDDYFGLLDDGEEIPTGLLDIGVGRLPVTSDSEANVILRKIFSYNNNKDYGDWRNTICFIADASESDFEAQADSTANYVIRNYTNFNVQKIYVDAYPEVSTSSGVRCPEVNSAILSQINSGALIMNYTGHGGVTGLSNYVILQNSDVEQWKNGYYPLFITATCELSRYDDTTQASCGELILLNPSGGSIALFSTTRLTYGNLNDTLNTRFYTNAFNGISAPGYRLGDMFLITKNESPASINKLNYTLLGDPAVSLAVPKYKIVTDSINHKAAGLTDTLKAYGNVNVKGRITDNFGSTLNNFSGIVYPTIFDKAETINTLGEYGDPVTSFQIQQNVLFRGKASVVNGQFSFNCIIPRDLNYNYGTGKISYYSNDSATDAAGNFQEFTIGGLAPINNFADSTGPAIRLFMNDTFFINGGVTDQYPTFLALVSDKWGINPGVNGIGHDIIGIMDNDQYNSYIMDNYYETDLNSYTSGTVTYKLPEMSLGMHSIKFTIWDNFNNSSQDSLNFKVVYGQNIVVPRIFNYPNPMSSYTNFIYEDNFEGSQQDVTIEIYNTSGKIVRELKTDIYTNGYSSGPMYWDGTDGNGNKINSGIYFYRIIVRSNGQTAISGTQKLIVIQ